jgi:hypothetical protein
MNDSILHKIRALRAKAQNAASTQAEVEAAAAAAAKLMIKHDVDESQLHEKDRSGAVEGEFSNGYHDIEIVIGWVFKGIEGLTETRGYRDSTTNTFKFIGLEPDVEMAIYLMEMTTQSAKRCWNGYVQEGFEQNKIIRKSVRPSFYHGFGQAIREKLDELAEERLAARSQAVGTALVVRKQDAIKAKMDEMGLVLRKRRAKQAGYLDPSARSAGVRGAGQVNLNRPFSGNATAGAIQ